MTTQQLYDQGFIFQYPSQY